MYVLPFLAILGFAPKAMTVYTSAGQSSMNWHGHSMFRSIHFEVVGRSRVLRTADVGATLTYSAVRQARSWFGYTYGDPNDSVRAESLYLFVRRESAHAFVDLGTGPMWSNRRVPAATSRFNFDSQLGAGVALSRLRIGYRFSHISNAGLARRNPGLSTHSVFVGILVKRYGAPPRAPALH